MTAMLPSLRPDLVLSPPPRPSHCRRPPIKSPDNKDLKREADIVTGILLPLADHPPCRRGPRAAGLPPPRPDRPPPCRRAPRGFEGESVCDGWHVKLQTRGTTHLSDGSGLLYYTIRSDGDELLPREPSEVDRSSGE